MPKVANGRCIRQLSRKSMKASRMRNVIAVMAIALTTILFTSLFTIGMSMKEGIEQNTFRQVGGYAHGTFKNLTYEQYEELQEDPLIKEWGVRRVLGMPEEAPFHKSHVEISCSDANNARWSYCEPIEGRLPKEGTLEAATDLQVLKLLGVTPRLGEEFTITFPVDGRETTQTFTLCGWWEYDPAIIANHVLIPESRVEAVLEETGVDPMRVSDGTTGRWNLELMFDSSLDIEGNMWQILQNHGFQTENPAADNYVAMGVNWAYMGAQLRNQMDPVLVLCIVVLLLLIIFTGYLIIYNIFRISVTNDIRFYGLLKTIGTTPGQLKRIIRQQALLLCIIGIPLGLLLGWLIGCRLAPVVIEQLNDIHSVVSFSPVIFIGASLFSLVTVLLSCMRPGKIAARVSPIEAVRYTERQTIKKEKKKGRKGTSLLSMAWNNLGRSRSKTLITALSLSLSVVLLVTTVTFTAGFDMNKYLSPLVCTDFILADASYFQVSGGSFAVDKAVSQEVIEEIEERAEIIGSGRVYGKTSLIQEFVTEEWFYTMHGRWNDREMLEQWVSQLERNEEGLLATQAQVLGMEPFVLDHLRVLEGDISQLYQPGSRYIAAVYSEDDYGNPLMDFHWAKVGDTVTLQYENSLQEYEVAALVVVPHPLSYRYYSSDGFVLNAQTFIQDSSTDGVMLFAFDTDEESIASTEEFLKDYTHNQNPLYDYESRSIYEAQFEEVRSMFLLMGGVLSFIVGLVGVLNYFNGILTGIFARKKEFAVLQSIGMTGKQLKRMLVYEGLLCILGTLILSLLLIIPISYLLATGAESIFWFFTYRLTLTPILYIVPFFILLGVLIPLVVYKFMEKSTVVERLREVEG